MPKNQHFLVFFDNFFRSVYDIDSQTADRVQRLVVIGSVLSLLSFDFALI